MLLDFIRTGIISHRYYKSRTNFMLAYMVSQLSWLTWIMLDTYYVFYPFVDNKSFVFFKALQESWFAFCSLSSVFVSANMLMVFMNKATLTNRLATAFGLLSLHLLLGGHLYLSQTLDPRMREFSLMWSQLQALWIVFMYFFDLTPAVYIFLSLLKSVPAGGIVKRLMTLHYYDKTVGILVLLQVANALWFMALTFVQYVTPLLRNDRNFYESYGLFTFSVVFHTILSCLLNYRIRHMLLLGNLLETAQKVRKTRKSPQKRLRVNTTNLLQPSRLILPDPIFTPSASSEKEVAFTESIPDYTRLHSSRDSIEYYPILPPLSADTNEKRQRPEFMSLPLPLNKWEKSKSPKGMEPTQKIENVPGLAIPYKSLSRQNTTYSLLFEEHQEQSTD